MVRATTFKLPFGYRFHMGVEKNGAADARALHFMTNVRASFVSGEAKRTMEALEGLPFALINPNLVSERGRQAWKQLGKRHQHADINLGSGKVTNVGVLAMANEAVTLAAPSGARINTLFLANQHFTGTGTTAEANTDIKIQTISTNGGQTAVAGTQSLVSAANSQKYRTLALFTYTGTEAVTEWGLHTSATRTATTGSPFTATSATSFTGTSSPYTASSSTVQGLQQSILEAGTTTVYGFVISNTTSVGTIPAWYKVADGTAGSTPGSNETYTIRPVMFDHKVFSAINVVNTDQIQFTYSLTVTPEA